jgi:signal transduction histidine kinase
VLVDDHVVGRYYGVLPKPSKNEGIVADLSSRSLKLHLPPDHRRVEFEFAAIGFRDPENIQFRYRLKGVDDDWMEAGTHRSASYPRLPGGQYVFQVTACNNDGDWNPRLAQVNVSFRRLHHRLGVLEQQAALQKERARIAKDIHDDLGASLTQIAFLGELARQDSGKPDKAAERVSHISATARQAIKSLDEIVWAVNPRNDTLAHLMDYAGQFAVDYLRMMDIRCRLDFPAQGPPRELSTDLRHNLFLAVKEALHNIVKHAHATEVWLRISYSGQALDIVVEDNGRGFEQEPDTALADGLRNMRQRMTDIGGEFRLESHAGHGTKIIFHLPWPAK